ncbi:MAG: hydroxyphenylacetyl-CoA thioesterase PaaI [Magnetospirillum sp. WYHS-4]
MTKAQETADAVGRFIGEGDLLARHLGVKLDEIHPGYARCTMTVRPDMSNAAAIGHGGATFALADTAFAYACNSHNRIALAANCTITFVGPAKIGDTLTAEAVETVLVRRSGVCDVTVTNQAGEIVALFRGHSRQIEGHLAPLDP